MTSSSPTRPGAGAGPGSPGGTGGIELSEAGPSLPGHPTPPAPRAAEPGQSRLADETAQGRTTISSAVVQKVAAIAAREISGVHELGGPGMARAFGAIRERIPGAGTSSTAGVAVEVGEKQAAVDLELVVEYGVGIVDLARAVRRNVITAVERITGLEVIEVNIAVNDIHLPEDDRAVETPPRVR